MELSARNRIKGTISSIKHDNVMAEVVVDVSGQEIVSTITHSSVERLGLAEGQEVTVIVKASDVLIGKE